MTTSTKLSSSCSTAFDGTLFRYFKDASNFEIEEPPLNAAYVPEIIENIWQNIDRSYYTKVLAKRLLRIPKDMSPDAREEFSRWIDNGDIEKFAKELPNRLHTSFDKTMELLRNKDFQQLLVDYPRAKRVFLVAHEAKDEVTSRRLFGKWEKPDDYLEAFAKFRPRKHEPI